MKTIKIKLRESGVNLYTVESFSNTAQLTIGMTVDRARLESWAGMARVQFDVLPPVKSAEMDGEQIELGAEVVTTSQSFDAESGGGVLEAAREFDALAIELSGVHGWSSDSVLQVASQPHAGNDNLGTIGIQGNIQRGNALATMRRNVAKNVGLEVEEIGKVAARAAALPILKKYAENMAVQPF